MTYSHINHTGSEPGLDHGPSNDLEKSIQMKKKKEEEDEEGGKEEGEEEEKAEGEEEK